MGQEVGQEVSTSCLKVKDTAKEEKTRPPLKFLREDLWVLCTEDEASKVTTMNTFAVDKAFAGP